MTISGLNPDPPADIVPASHREFGARGRGRRFERLAQVMAANAPPGGLTVTPDPALSRWSLRHDSRPPGWARPRPQTRLAQRPGIAARRRMNPCPSPGRGWRDDPATTGDP
jgi:hypothetical protein